MSTRGLQNKLNSGRKITRPGPCQAADCHVDHAIAERLREGLNAGIQNNAGVSSSPRTAQNCTVAGRCWITIHNGVAIGSVQKDSAEIHPPVAVAVDVFVPPDVFEGFVVTRVLVYSPVTSDVEANSDWLLETFTVLPMTST